MAAEYIALGIIIDDIVFPDGQTQMGVLGGGGPQTAWGMALATQDGAQVGMLSGVGQDFTPDLLAPLLAMDIDVTGVHATNLPTPRAWQLLEEDGRRQHVWRIDQDTADLQTHPDAPTILQFYPAATVVHWGIHPEAPHLSPAQPLREQDVLVSIEPFKGLEQPLTDDDLQAVLTACAIYSPNWAEAVSIFGTADRKTILERARQQGGYILVLRHGPAGAEAWDLHRGHGIKVPAVPVDTVVDPVGAGDAFCGAFAVTWQQTNSLAKAAISGAVAASYMLEQIGIPTRRPTTESINQRKQSVYSAVQTLNFDNL
ncbi:PfkB family carbohydrate kinase [Chloroflexota bacterium]